MSVVLGIDPGLAKLGYGIVEAKGSVCRALVWGVIETSPEREYGERLETIYNHLNQLVKEYHPQNAGIEEIYFSKNRTSAMLVAQALGVARLAMKHHNISVKMFSPIQVKQSVTGEGRAEKAQVQEMVRLILGLKEIPTPDHAADALACALCAYHARDLETIC